VNVLDRVRRRVVKATKRPMDGARSPAAASVLELPVRHESSCAVLSARSHALLVTFKRDSGAVPTPVWFAFDGDDRLYVWTEVNAYNAKRVPRNPEALLAPCDGRGTPLGPPIAARGRVLTDPAERDRAARVIRGSWNVWQRVFEVASRPVTPVHYIESVPAP
jgi:PPOX class probable F420-dependent enzyme